MSVLLLADAGGGGGLAGTVADWSVKIMDVLGSPGAGLANAIDSIIPIVPSEVILPLAGFAAGKGTINLYAALVWTTIGSIVGSLAMYYIGAAFGRERVLGWAKKIPLVQVHEVERTEAWFLKHGTKTVFFGRMVPVFRSLISIPAGVNRMPLGKFILFTALGSAIWNTIFVLAGYALGNNWSKVEEYGGIFSKLIIALIVLAVAYFVISRLVRRRRDRLAGDDPDSPDAVGPDGRPMGRRRGRPDPDDGGGFGADWPGWNPEPNDQAGESPQYRHDERPDPRETEPTMYRARPADPHDSDPRDSEPTLHRSRSADPRETEPTMYRARPADPREPQPSVYGSWTADSRDSEPTLHRSRAADPRESEPTLHRSRPGDAREPEPTSRHSRPADPAVYGSRSADPEPAAYGSRSGGAEPAGYGSRDPRDSGTAAHRSRSDEPSPGEPYRPAEPDAWGAEPRPAAPPPAHHGAEPREYGAPRHRPAEPRDAGPAVYGSRPAEPGPAGYGAPHGYDAPHSEPRGYDAPSTEPRKYGAPPADSPGYDAPQHRPAPPRHAGPEYGGPPPEYPESRRSGPQHGAPEREKQPWEESPRRHGQPDDDDDEGPAGTVYGAPRRTDPPPERPPYR